MKITINYDLIDKIRESKIGFSLKRDSRRTFMVVGLATLLGLPKILSYTNPGESFLFVLSFNTFLCCGHRGIENIILRKLYIKYAIEDLKQLSKTLRGHYINTDYELLQNSYGYATNYSFILDDEKIPRLKQEKYIKIPVVDKDGMREVSLVQEHLIGSKEYELSYGSPKKVLKPVFNGI